MNIESSHKFTRSGDTAYGCIEGVNLTDYQVGVFGGRRITPKTENEGIIYATLWVLLEIKFDIMYSRSRINIISLFGMHSGCSVYR